MAKRKGALTKAVERARKAGMSDARIRKAAKGGYKK